MTIFVRGGTDHVVSEVERAVVDARGAVSSALEDGKYVVGGGSVEMEISRELHDYAVQIGGREQLAIQAFALMFESSFLLPILLYRFLRDPWEEPCKLPLEKRWFRLHVYRFA